MAYNRAGNLDLQIRWRGGLGEGYPDTELSREGRRGGGGVCARATNGTDAGVMD
jgi:hypothetical protein